MVEKYHFIGIGGIGMSGLAKIMLSQKKIVSGSDLASSYVTEHLEKAGAKIFIGHSSKNISEGSTVVYTTGLKENNPELSEALRLKCPMLHRSDLLQHLMNGYKTIAIAGTHGKTTTTSLLAYVMVSAGFDPSYAVGGMVTDLQSNAGYGTGEYFVAEADESDGTFLKYNPFGAIVTNIDLDHMNYFHTEEALHMAFQMFMEKVANEEHLFWCGEDTRLQKLKPKGISYGLSSQCMLRAENISQKEWHLCFDITFKGKTYPAVSVSLIGKHNVLNALAVFGLALSLGIPEAAIRSAFLTFKGIKRRCEKKCEFNHGLILDDYAHHPTEIQTTLEGIRQAIGNRRLIAVFQPHRYSRTKDCLGTYRGIFTAVDKVFITDIFAAEESPIIGVTHEKVMEEIQQDSLPEIVYVPRKNLAEVLAQNIKANDVVVTLGAGDITKISSELATLQYAK